MSWFFLLAIAFVLSVLLCGVYLQLARRWQFLDHPNQRSSHSRPTPHGGGAPTLLSFALMVGLAALCFVSWQAAYLWMLALGLSLMALGVVDDAVQLSVPLRFSIYSLCCLLLSWLFLSSVSSGTWLVLPIALALLWLLNLYNFMDGIDGIAAIQGFIASCTAGLLAVVYQGAFDYALFCFLLGFSLLGFLAWNLPPAKLFMGDAGSVPLGFLLGALALFGEVSGALPAACWLILLAAFITDATWTLLSRLLRGEKVTEAHREHLYQRLSRRWGSHWRVDMALLAVLAFWLFPMALAAQTYQQYQLFHVILAYFPLLLCMAKMRHLP
ncbi:glycosyl transferase family 4 [Parahaliea sp. F7430]|uniref:Glycosyl transferase family 4 n=1 Tax=Sediminihaliea albiluteola TaxID=2758564 RepID=A0A7W2TVS1_9GAMM|nr:glycosyl transferase family 4 [Sediminihaliea albiluteola]MBA6412853.1 glycosyl transferase family 4 [Sediminihaliea albiluteola]